MFIDILIGIPLCFIHSFLWWYLFFDKRIKKSLLWAIPYLFICSLFGLLLGSIYRIFILNG